ncbi:hypothetical protein OQA88_9734 [Cercophora sp. LCS_1]
MRRRALPILKTTLPKQTRVVIATPNDIAIRDAVRHAAHVDLDSGRRGSRNKFSDLVFTRTFSAFDRQNEDAANSPFHGFFTLFWMAVFLFVVKVGAENWRAYGNVLGTNEIASDMFGRDVVVLLVADAVIIVMLMKQHSYAFYNGYLSSIYKRRAHLLAKLEELQGVSPARTPSQTAPPVSAISTSHLVTRPSAHGFKERRRSMQCAVGDIDKISAAIASGEPLDEEQIRVFERILKWEVDAITDELRGKATSAERAYPNNVTLPNHYEFIVLPTLVYEVEYPRSDSINFYYAAEKFTACFGILFVMIMVSQHFIYPVVVDSLRLKEEGMPLGDRFAYFPWMLLKLIFPFMMEYLLTWYLIWEAILNFVAEVTYFADRSFYADWWNCVSWDQFARDWNRPVHNFLLRHVYHSSISAMKVDKHTATLITFFLSACFHELVMWCIFKKLRGYLLFLQMCQLPLVRLSRTTYLRDKATLGNMFFWFVARAVRQVGMDSAY